MGNRRSHRAKTHLLVAASAITRACTYEHPSRTTVLRLLGDALHTFEESQLVIDHIKARTLAYTASDRASVTTRLQLDADNRVRSAHEQGARALFSAVSNALIKLPTRAGPLRRRAVDLLTATGKAAGPAVVMQAATNVRSHISTLKRLTWSNSERGDFEVVCAIMTLADVSNSAIAGRDVAKDSVIFLLSAAVRQKCKRTDLAYAVAHIVQSFPVHAPPDDRLIDNLLSFALTSATSKHASAGLGCALLVAVAVPHLVSRGPKPADDVVSACGRLIRTASTSTERAMWAVAMVRASVTARRSPQYQLLKYGNSDTESKFPRNQTKNGQRPTETEMDSEEQAVSVWVSDETFEEALVQISQVSGLEEGRVDASIAVAGLLRMWRMALPSSIPKIIPRAFLRLLPNLGSVVGVSALVDGIWLGLLKELEPSLSSTVLEQLLPALSDERDLPLSAVLHVCSTLLLKYGRQSVQENGLSRQYNNVCSVLMKRAHQVLDVSSHFVRMGGVRTMSALVSALPRQCSSLLTTVLQELRIADLTMANKQPLDVVSRTFVSLNSVEKELSAILGNSAALSVLIGKVLLGECSVPDALWRQCTIDSLSLLRHHPANQAMGYRDTLSYCIRRRAGWGLVAAHASSKHMNFFQGDSLQELISLWKEELGFAGDRSSKSDLGTASIWQGSGSVGSQGSDDQTEFSLDEVRARASTRSAALHALSCALRYVCSADLIQCGRVLLGACAARIIAKQNAYGLSIGSSSSSFNTSWGNEPGSSSDPSERRRNLLNLSKALTMESYHLVECMNFISPRGDGSELCYYIAICLGEEAERLVGEGETTSLTDLTAVQGSSGSFDRAYLSDTVILNHMPTLNHSFHLRRSVVDAYPKGPDRIDIAFENERYSCKTNENLWPFSMHGLEALNAENVLVSCAVGIAMIVAEDLKSSGAVVQSLSSGKVGPSMSAIILLELSRRLSLSDLAEINRALAVLQILAKRSLGVTGGMHRGALSESKTGKLYTPHPRGDGNNLTPENVPGTALQRITKARSWWRWTRSFSNEGRISEVPFHDFHSRALGIMYSTRLIAAEGLRELGSTGSAALWIGLMKRVLSVIRDNLNCVSTSQCALLGNSFAGLGALLEVVPKEEPVITSEASARQTNAASGPHYVIEDICAEAISVITEAIEKGNADAQSAAALALSHCSPRIAASSETLLNALLKAWAHDRGHFTAMGQIGRSVGEADAWAVCFSQIWRDMGVKGHDISSRFFIAGSSGIGTNSPCLVAGAAAVLSSCRLHCWAPSESGYHATMEMSTELLQWSGDSSRKARAAGLHAMTALWAWRIDAARLDRISKTDFCSGTTPSFAAQLHSDAEVSPFLPVESFSLKEPTKINSAVGPFLDEVLYEAMAPHTALTHSDELQQAAIAAVTEIIRGVGVEETCSKLLRLPENLFASVENGSTEAKWLLHILVTADAKTRPTYWVGLCRAVCTGGDRLNYGKSKSSWDVTYPTKVFASRIAAEAVDSSLGACSCLQQEKQVDSSRPCSHKCAFDFFLKITDFACGLCQQDCFDFEACIEGCNMIERIASRMGSSAAAWKSDDKTLCDYRSAWDACMVVMENLLEDSSPYRVLSSAGSAFSELLISFLTLSEVEYFRSDRHVVVNFLKKSLRQDFCRRLLYSDQHEMVGINATFDLIAQFARVMTAWCATSITTATLCAEDAAVLQPAKAIFVAIIGDFISLLAGDGLHVIAESGGALTSVVHGNDDLWNAFLFVIEPIVLGAIASVNASCGIELASNGYVWTNSASAGAKLVENQDQLKNAIAACYVWLLSEFQKEESSIHASPTFGLQNQEALFCFCTSNGNCPVNGRELFLSFAKWDRSAFFNFVSQLSRFGKVDHAVLCTIADVALSSLEDVIQDDDLGDMCEDDLSHIVTEAIAGLTRIFFNLRELDITSGRLLAGRALDSLFRMVGSESRDIVLMYNDVELQRSVCNCLSACITFLTDCRRVTYRCMSRVMKMFYNAYKEESLPLLKLGMAMGTTLYGIVKERKMETDLVQMLQTPIAYEREEALSELMLGWTLRCFGTEQFIVDVVQRGLAQDSGNSENARALVYQLGLLGLSTRHFCIPASLRVALSAIRFDAGRECAINRVGLLLYSICLSKLIRSFPSKSANMASTASQPKEGASFLLEIAANDPSSLRNIVSLLGEAERKTVKLLLLAPEAERKHTNAKKKQLTHN